MRRLVGKMRLDLGTEIGVAREIVAVGEALLQQQVHHGERQRAVGAGPQHQADVGRLDGGRAIDVDDHQLGAALLAGLGDVGHGVDLGRDGIAAPHDDQVGLGHLARIGSRQLADAGAPARFGGRHADRGLLARIAEGMAQPVDAPALHDAHRAAGMIGPYRFSAVGSRRAREGLGDFVQRGIPRDRPERALPLLARPLQRLLQPVGMVHALGIARDLGADDAIGVAVRGGAADAADARRRQRARLRASRRSGNRADRPISRIPCPSLLLNAACDHGDSYAI